MKSMNSNEMMESEEMVEFCEMVELKRNWSNSIKWLDSTKWSDSNEMTRMIDPSYKHQYNRSVLKWLRLSAVHLGLGLYRESIRVFRRVQAMEHTLFSDCSNSTIVLCRSIIFFEFDHSVWIQSFPLNSIDFIWLELDQLSDFDHYIQFNSLSSDSTDFASTRPFRLDSINFIWFELD